MVKADAYGHGAVRCAQAFAQAGAAWLAVSRLTEALELRRAGQKLPILILGRTEPQYAPVLAEYRITQCCYSLPYARALSQEAQKAGVRVQIHLKADTGMGRIGFPLRSDFDGSIREMLASASLPGLEMTGLFQHFAAADEAAGDSVAYTAEQHALFVRAFEALRAAGREPALVHCDNSAGTLLHPDWPAGLPRERCMHHLIRLSAQRRRFLPRPAPRHDPQDGGQHGQGTPARPIGQLWPSFYRPASHPGRHPLCRLRRRLSPSAQRGQTLGRVCMDQMLVDVTDLPGVAEGDEAILWGGSSAGDTAETIAQKTGTISYEILCGVARRVPRVYLEQGQPVCVDDHLDS